MRNRFVLYLLCVTMIGSLLSWSSMLSRAASGNGSGNSWHSNNGGLFFFGGGGGNGGGFAGSVGGGHK